MAPLIPQTITMQLRTRFIDDQLREFALRGGKQVREEKSITHLNACKDRQEAQIIF